MYNLYTQHTHAYVGDTRVHTYVIPCCARRGLFREFYKRAIDVIAIILLYMSRVVGVDRGNLVVVVVVVVSPARAPVANESRFMIASLQSSFSITRVR